MALVNHAKKEINAKIVYFGPPGCGKGSALQYIFSRLKPSLRGELKNVQAGGDNLRFIDFSPFDGPLRDGYRVRLHVYTLTGPVTNQATWKMTLKGSDGVIIMVDASPGRILEAQESVSQLRDFLSAYGVGLHDTPAVLQFNRLEQEQDVTDSERLICSTDLAGLQCCFSCTSNGEGVLEALTSLSRLVLGRIAEKESPRSYNTYEPVACVPEGVLESYEDGSEVEARNPSEISADETPTEILPPVSLACCGAVVEGTTLRIPLDISCSGTIRRLVINVSVGTEQDR